MKRLICLLSVMFLAACGGGGEGTQVARSPIEWDRSPTTVVFRASVEGGTGDDPFLARNKIPPCTVYGDNRVVWTNEIGPFNTQVLWDKVSDEQLRQFITDLTINRQIYNYAARSNLEPATSDAPAVETLTIFVNGDARTSDAFSGWGVDYYRSILDACRQISTAPVLFEPTAAWVSAEARDYDFTAPVIAWDAAANNLSLAELAASGERKWVTDRNVPVLWNLLLNSPSNLQIIEGEAQYIVALEVPGVTRDAPPAPAS